MSDLLQSSPLIQAIKEKGSQSSITLLASETTKDIARMIPGGDEVLGFDFEEADRTVTNGLGRMPIPMERDSLRSFARELNS
jgi:ADP-heptose:LPS heptosyltransferase